MLQTEVEVTNRLGLHLRAAKALVEAVAPLTAEVTLSNGDRSASCRSILSLITLEAVAGTTLGVAASGPDAAQALAVVQALFADRFGESD